MLSYLALRLAAKEALVGFTIAGDRVYDSRQFPLDGPSDLDEGPSLSVYTEEARAHDYGSGHVNPRDLHVWLTIEAVVLVKGSIQYVDADGQTSEIEGTAVPVTDQEHEAIVDMLCTQVRRRLSVGGCADLDTAATLFRAANMGASEAEDFPQRDRSKVDRLAGRTMRFKFKVKPDAWAAPGSGVTGGTSAALPEPLASLSKLFTLPSSLATVARLADMARGASAAPPLATDVNLIVGVGRPPDPDPDINATA